MGFRKDAYAKVWDVKPVSNAQTQLRISISHKNRQTEEYEEDFSGFIKCFGTAVAKKAANLSKGARIKLGDVDTCSWYNKDTKETKYSFKCFSFEVADSNASSSQAAAQSVESITDTQSEVDSGEFTEDSLPF